MGRFNVFQESRCVRYQDIWVLRVDRVSDRVQLLPAAVGNHVSHHLKSIKQDRH